MKVGDWTRFVRTHVDLDGFATAVGRPVALRGWRIVVGDASWVTRSVAGAVPKSDNGVHLRTSVALLASRWAPEPMLMQRFLRPEGAVEADTGHPHVVALSGPDAGVEIDRLLQEIAAPALTIPFADHVARAEELVAAGVPMSGVLLEWLGSVHALALDRERVAEVARRLDVEVERYSGAEGPTGRRRDRMAELAVAPDERVAELLRETAEEVIQQRRLPKVDPATLPFPCPLL